MKKRILFTIAALISIAVIMNSCKSELQETGVVSVRLAQQSSLDSLETAWEAYVSADSISKTDKSDIDKSLIDVPKTICAKLMEINNGLKDKTDRESLAKSERCLNLMQKIYNVVGENSGIKMDQYGRLVALSRKEHSKTIPTGDEIKKERYILSDKYVTECLSSLNLWNKYNDAEEKERAIYDKKKALELNPDNQKAKNIKIR